MSSSRRMLRRFLLLCLIGGAAYFTSGWTLPWIGGWLNVGTWPQRADYAMVLLGDNETRPFAAAALVNKQLAERVLVPQFGPAVGVESIWPSPHEVAARVLAARGIAEDKIIFLPGASGNTSQEILSLAEFVQDQPKATVNIAATTLQGGRSPYGIA